jgi:hypothetical protein
MSTLNHYFHRPTGSFNYRNDERSFCDLTYIEYFSLFRLQKYDRNRDSNANYFVERMNPYGQPQMHVILRSGPRPHLARIHDIPPSHGEVFYLRTLLQHRPYCSHEDARTVDGVQYETYQEAATELGLFANEKEAEYALLEGIQNLKTPRQLRLLFVHLLVNDCIPTPMLLWENIAHHLAFDHTLRHQNIVGVGIEYALRELGDMLSQHGKSLSNYNLPEPSVHGREVEHEMTRWNANPEALSARANTAIMQFNDEKWAIYNDVIGSLAGGKSLHIFVDGKAGTGKTHLLNVICNKVRSLGRIVLPTAAAAFAAQHYAGGRTTHSAFKVCFTHYHNTILANVQLQIPVNDNNEMLESPIQPHDPRGELIRLAGVIMSDEAPMLNKAALACVDDTCRRVMQVDEIFGGKIFILSGDFRQTCPVVRKGSKAQVIDASIRSWPFWDQMKIYHLTIPHRNARDPEFQRWVDSIGDGAGPEVSLSMLHRVENFEDVLNFVYPAHILADPLRCIKCSILAPTHRQVDQYNDTILKQIYGPQRTYMASDSLKEITAAGMALPSSVLDYAAKQTPPGLPPHTLRIKIGGIYRLIRNFSVDRGLVKNARVIVSEMGNRLITVRLIHQRGDNLCTADEDFLIPRICFTHVLPSGHTLIRRQFPLTLAYATTFNSCQGLNLDCVGVDVTYPVFSHGQLYTALSRIPDRTCAVVRMRPGEISTVNITYPELLLS